MLYRRRKRRRNYRWLAVLLSVLIFAVVVIKVFESHVSDLSYGYIPNAAQRVTTKAITDAVERYLGSNPPHYDDLATLHYSESGAVTAIETDSAKMNLLKSRLTRAAQDEVEKIKRCEVSIPLGAFTKLTLLSNTGPDITLNYSLTGSFDSEIISSFESAGINQTVHHLTLVVHSKIITASLDYRGELEFSTDFELCQSVIVGEVPNVNGGYVTAIP